MGWLLASRRRLLVAGLVALGLLDAGRSLYARVGYRHPAPPFSGAPFDTDYRWPAEKNIQAGDSDGRQLYVRYCSMCHGLRGNGLGPAAGNMVVRPRDLTTGRNKFKSTPFGTAATDDDLMAVIGDGLIGTAMPGFRDLLSEPQRRALVAYLRTLAAPAAVPVGAVVEIPPRPPSTAAAIARGRGHYERHCLPCHGSEGTGRDLAAGVARGEWGSRDLTAPWTFRGGAAPEQVWRRITTGIEGGPMTAFAAILTPEERWDLSHYVASLARPAPWSDGGALQGLGRHPDPLRRGEYLVRSLTCTYCHTESVLPMNYNVGRFLGGGAATRAWPDGTVITPNITADRETGIGTWSEAEIARALRLGRTPSRSLDLGFKQWFFYPFTDDDAAAIARFLRQVPPRRHRIPPPLRYGLVETVVGKLARLPLITPVELKIPVPTGPFGEARPSLVPYDWPQRLLVAGQWLVLLGMAAGWIVLHRRQPRPSGRRRALALVGLGVAVALLGAVYWMHVLVPRAPMNAFIDRALPRPPELDGGSPGRRRLLARGRELYRVSCVQCHQLDGAGGDWLSDPYAGSFTLRNITSHPERGIGRWSEEQIVRALRSGVTPDGRVLFWGFMPWDMFGNLDEEDVRALAAYVKLLPPSDRLTPPNRPPSPDHPPEITWRIEMSRLLARIREAMR